MSEKICSVCKVPKPIGEFNRNKSRKDGFESYCRSCWSAISKKQYASNKEYYKSKAASWKGSYRIKLEEMVNQAKGTTCMDCGIPYPSYILEFDHVRGVKVDNIATMVAEMVPMDLIRREIDKCEVVCANCHKTRHYVRRRNKSEGYLSRKVTKPRPKKGNWPEATILQEMVLAMPALEVAKLVGVSSVAVKKMCDKLGLETRPRGYWAKNGKHIDPVAQFG